ncbi:hypothetical protein MKX03_002444 [Papaver bracteatum]|nr:hypothetical protein MKX03_002444 [Papaver bracteatum]
MNSYVAVEHSPTSIVGRTPTIILGCIARVHGPSLGSCPLRAPTAKCDVCSENLVINDKMQEFPCKHLFHPLCLMPWLEKHNSCPVCRHELPTDNQAYEIW